MTDDIVTRRNELYRRIQHQVRLLSKLRNERQSASLAERPQYDRDIQVVSDDIEKLNAVLQPLKDDSEEA